MMDVLLCHHRLQVLDGAAMMMVRLIGSRMQHMIDTVITFGSSCLT